MVIHLLLVACGQDIRVTTIKDRQDGAVVELSTGGSEGRVVSSVVEDLCLGKHGKVLDFRLSKMRTVRGDEDQLGLTLAKLLDGVLVSQNGFTGLHDQLKPTVH